MEDESSAKRRLVFTDADEEQCAQGNASSVDDPPAEENMSDEVNSPPLVEEVPLPTSCVKEVKDIEDAEDDSEPIRFDPHTVFAIVTVVPFHKSSVESAHVFGILLRKDCMPPSDIGGNIDDDNGRTEVQWAWTDSEHTTIQCRTNDKNIDNLCDEDDLPSCFKYILHAHKLQSESPDFIAVTDPSFSHYSHSTLQMVIVTMYINMFTHEDSDEDSDGSYIVGSI